VLSPVTYTVLRTGLTAIENGLLPVLPFRPVYRLTHAWAPVVAWYARVAYSGVLRPLGALLLPVTKTRVPAEFTAIAVAALVPATPM